MDMQREAQRAASAARIMDAEAAGTDTAELIAQHEREFGEPWVTRESLAAQKKQTKAEQREREWEEALSAARAKGWKSAKELGLELGIRWDQVLSWIDSAGLYPDQFVDLDPDDRYDQPRATSCGLYQYAADTLAAHYRETMEGYKAADEVANAEADKQYQQGLEEKRLRLQEDEQRQRDYRARVAKERAEREEARQLRLAARREKRRRESELQHAKRMEKRSGRQLTLAKGQYYASANRILWAAFALTRRGKQNFEYASTKFTPVGRGWARGVMERYQRNYDAAVERLAKLQAEAENEGE